MPHEFEISCCLCSNSHKVSIDLPAGWTSQYESSDEEFGLCPAHSQVKPFIQSQCSGCVGGWGDCDLWRSFAYQNKSLTDNDLDVIKTGVCPKRTNGTFCFSRDDGFKPIDLRDENDEQAGVALAAAIKDYWDRYQR